MLEYTTWLCVFMCLSECAVVKCHTISIFHCQRFCQRGWPDFSVTAKLDSEWALILVTFSAGMADLLADILATKEKK